MNSRQVVAVCLSQLPASRALSFSCHPVSSFCFQASHRPASSALFWWRRSREVSVWTPALEPTEHETAVTRFQMTFSNWWYYLFVLKRVFCVFAYHHGEHHGCGRGLDDPQQNQTGQLDQREDMDLPQRNVAQVDQIWLVLGRHSEQLDTVKELWRTEGDIGFVQTAGKI